MKRPELSRRDFNRLAVTAFGGVVAGTVVGCSGGDKKASKPAGQKPARTSTMGMSMEEKTGKPKDDAPKGDAPEDGEAVAKADNACAGLNACKGQGKGGESACAGQSACATVEHTCAEENTCKNLGGCGASAGNNECKGKGGCKVPMERDSGAWKAARKAFEERMKAADTKFGAAPAA